MSKTWKVCIPVLYMGEHKINNPEWGDIAASEYKHLFKPAGEYKGFNGWGWGKQYEYRARKVPKNLKKGVKLYITADINSRLLSNVKISSEFFYNSIKLNH